MQDGFYLICSLQIPKSGQMMKLIKNWPELDLYIHATIEKREIILPPPNSRTQRRMCSNVSFSIFIPYLAQDVLILKVSRYKV